MKTGLRPQRSAKPPNTRAPSRIPNRGAAVSRPRSAAFRANSSWTSGRAMPPMKTMKPSKNLPAEASTQTSHCIEERGGPARPSPLDQRGTSSM